MPPDFTARLAQIFPQGQLPVIHNAYLTIKPHTLRVNTIKTNDKEVQRYFIKQKIDFEKDKLIPHCYYLKNISHKKITGLDIYTAGKIYLQNASSQIPALILNPQAGESILDMCASPGGKTTQMAALMNNAGQIIALEPEKFRFDRLCHNIAHQGATNITAINQRGESFQRQTQQRFDKILVDAPCSGSGTFLVSDRATFSHWSIDMVIKTAKLQKKLLQSAIRICRNGGFILYTTCSIEPEENELVINEMLRDNPCVKLCDLPATTFLQILKPSLTSWQGTVFSKQEILTKRIYPSNTHQGFFMALMHVS